MVFNDRSVGVIEELVDAPEEDEGWNVPRVDFNYLLVGVSSINQSSGKQAKVKGSTLRAQINKDISTGYELDSFVCGTQIDERVDPRYLRRLGDLG